MYTPSTIQLYIQFVAVENMRSASVENITLSVYILDHELLRRLVGCLSILCKLSKKIISLVWACLHLTLD